MEIRTVSSRVVYANPWMSVREDEIERSDGSPGIYGVVDKPDFALVVPYENGGLHLVEQYRYPVRQRLWELPQGVWGGPDADPLEVAAHELAEETGLRAGRLRHLGHLDLAPGLMTQEFDVWLATELTQGPTAREESEADMRHAFVSEAELRRMIRSGRFTDAPSLAGFSLLLLDRA